MIYDICVYVCVYILDTLHCTTQFITHRYIHTLYMQYIYIYATYATYAIYAIYILQ